MEVDVFVVLGVGEDAGKGNGAGAWRLDKGERAGILVVF